MPETIIIQVVVDAKTKREIKALAKHERRTLSNMAGFLLTLGKLKYYETDLEAAKANGQPAQPKEGTAA